MIFLEHVVFGGFGMFDFCANVNFSRQYEGNLYTPKGVIGIQTAVL